MAGLAVATVVVIVAVADDANLSKSYGTQKNPLTAGFFVSF